MPATAFWPAEIKAGDVVFILYEGPKGGPGMQEMLYPTSYLKSMHLGKDCALVTDGRFSGGTSGLSIGHVSPEAAGGGAIGLVRDGDTVEINIPERTIMLKIGSDELARRREEEDGKGREGFCSGPAADRFAGLEGVCPFRRLSRPGSGAKGSGRKAVLNACKR